RCHDAAEVYDGVPSTHDAKAAAIIGKLHLDGASEAWPLQSEEERALVAVVRTMQVYAVRYQRCLARLGALLVRHWPELAGLMKLERVALLELLAAYGVPAAVAADEAGARELMRRVG
ncbi:MAG: IS110 family transposase, partial [bacterium]|nr:IS110 family transposase [bacterium]